MRSARIRLAGVTLASVAGLAFGVIVPGTASAQTVSVTPASQAVLGPEAASVDDGVTYTCIDPSDTLDVIIQIVQAQGKVLVSGLGGSEVPCSSQGFTAVVSAIISPGQSARPFKQGGAAASATAEEVNSFGQVVGEISAPPQEITISKK